MPGRRREDSAASRSENSRLPKCVTPRQRLEHQRELGRRAARWAGHRTSRDRAGREEPRRHLSTSQFGDDGRGDGDRELELGRVEGPDPAARHPQVQEQRNALRDRGFELADKQAGAACRRPPVDRAQRVAGAVLPHAGDAARVLEQARPGAFVPDRASARQFPPGRGRRPSGRRGGGAGRRCARSASGSRSGRPRRPAPGRRGSRLGGNTRSSVAGARVGMAGVAAR